MSAKIYYKLMPVLFLVWLAVTLAQTSIALKDGETPDGKAVYISGIVGAIALSIVFVFAAWGARLKYKGQLGGGGGDFSGLSAASFY